MGSFTAIVNISPEHESYNMKQGKQKKLLHITILLPIVISFLLLPVSVYAQNESLGANEIRKLQITPVTKIRIPGLNFSELQVVEENGTTYLTVPFLGEYIAALYKWLVAAAAVVAVIAIIRAGLMWTLSGGNETQIGDAKKNIGNTPSLFPRSGQNRRCRLSSEPGAWKLRPHG